MPAPVVQTRTAPRCLLLISYPPPHTRHWLPSHPPLAAFAPATGCCRTRPTPCVALRHPHRSRGGPRPTTALVRAAPQLLFWPPQSPAPHGRTNGLVCVQCTLHILCIAARADANVNVPPRLLSCPPPPPVSHLPRRRASHTRHLVLATPSCANSVRERAPAAAFMPVAATRFAPAPAAAFPPTPPPVSPLPAAVCRTYAIVELVGAVPCRPARM